MTGADLSHIDTWLFDLDNTLYPAEAGLGVEISARITAYVAALTGLGHEPAQALQKRYLDDYGLTLRGLMLHHGVDPDVFHAIFHDLSLAALARDEALVEAIAGLPGRRLVFTNAHEGHARRVLARLGLDRLFDGVFHIGQANYAPKPAPEAFERMIAAFGLRAAATCFFEDRALNLQPAAALGMTTVLVGLGAEANADPFIRHRAPRLAPFLAAARVKELT